MFQIEADVIKKQEHIIRYFNIRNCNIPRLDDHIFMGMKIEHLLIHNCSKNIFRPSHTISYFSFKLIWKELNDKCLFKHDRHSTGFLTAVNDSKLQNVWNRCYEYFLKKNTSGVNFINVLRTAFTLIGPKSANWHCWRVCLFCAFGIYERKSCT